MPFVGIVLVAVVSQAVRVPVIALAGLRFIAPATLVFFGFDVADDAGFARIALFILLFASVASVFAVVQTVVG